MAPELLASVLIQLALAYLFGHVYDMPILMATGYLVGTGKNPYVSTDLSLALKSPIFRRLTTIGYPPPWALLMGAVYLGVYRQVPSLSLYHFAVKIPVVAANISLAFFVRAILREGAGEEDRAHAAWTFFLLNPFLLYSTAAWGQFDSAVALTALSALYSLHKGRPFLSALLLALALSLKPTPLPLLPVCTLFMVKKGLKRTLIWLGSFFTSLLLLCAGPFFAFRWSPSPIIHGWNAHLSFAGALSFGSFIELFQRSYSMTGNPWVLGLLWVPALALGVWLLPSECGKFEDILAAGTGATLIVFLTRSWLSESNIVLLLPFLVILVSFERIDRRFLRGLWISPMVFSLFNFSPPQLLFLHFPRAMAEMFRFDARVHTVRLIVKSVSVLPWQFCGWCTLIRCYRSGVKSGQP